MPSALRLILKNPKNRDTLRDLLDEAIALADERDRSQKSEAQRAAEAREIALSQKHIDADKKACVRLVDFVRRAWPVLEPKAVYVHNWHIDAICAHLEAVTDGRINRLLINVPPGSMKSLLVTVLWPAWEWSQGHRSYRYITTSFAEDATTRDTRKMRDLVASEWYQARWPEVRLVRRGDSEISNTSTGFRESSPFGSLTSKRGDRLIIDDPHSVKTAESDAERAKTTLLFREGALNRLNDQRKSAIVVIMQRLHPDDISGLILKLMADEYVHLCLPMEFDPKDRCVTRIGFRDPRTERDELLDPVRFPREEVAKLKKGMGSHAYAGQYQQKPSNREGGLFKREYFAGQIVERAPAGGRAVRRWDLAASLQKPGTDPDWSVGLKMKAVRVDGVDRRFYVEDVLRFRTTPMQVRLKIKAVAIGDGHAVDIFVPEDPGQAGKDQGQNIVSQLAGYTARARRESGSKGDRAEPFAAQCEAFNVFLVKGDWNEAFIDELCSFPVGHDDQVDAASGAFAELAGDDTSEIVIPDMSRANPNAIN